jgi:hypothetical protein
MNWGRSIILAFVLFATFIGVLVTVCVRQDISLVSTEYYKEELDFQKQMDRERNTQQLGHKPEINMTEDHTLKVDFDFSQFEKGKLVLYSPGDIKQDRVFTLQRTVSSYQTFPLDDIRGGNYKIRMVWSVNGKEFFFEKTIYI